MQFIAYKLNNKCSGLLVLNANQTYPNAYRMSLNYSCVIKGAACVKEIPTVYMYDLCHTVANYESIISKTPVYL